MGHVAGRLYSSAEQKAILWKEIADEMGITKGIQNEVLRMPLEIASSLSIFVVVLIQRTSLLLRRS